MTCEPHQATALGLCRQCGRADILAWHPSRDGAVVDHLCRPCQREAVAGLTGALMELFEPEEEC